MTYKTKLKTEQFFYGLLTFFGFALIGGVAGFFIGKIQKQMNLEGVYFIVIALLVLTLLFLIYTINIFLHEIGHLIFGLLSGYEFNSIRFGKLMLIKENGKLRFCKYNLPGTGGQCIMTAPNVDAQNLKVVLYNLGGLFVNILILVIFGALFFAFKETLTVASMIFFMFSSTSLLILITNGLPFSQMGTDGANTIILYKDKNARLAFKNQLEIVKYLSKNYSLLEMPKDLFTFDKSIPLTNPLITSQAINYYNYLSLNKMYADAKETALFILENAKSINNIHQKILYGELLFIAAVIEKDNEAAKKIFTEHKKELLQGAGFISIQRYLYAYYSLVEIDEKKAKNYAKMFEASLKNYPYPKDAKLEKEQFDMVKQGE